MFLLKKPISYASKRAWTGRLFILPWFIGFFLFFAYPLVESLIYVFHEIKLTGSGFEKIYTGVANIRRAFMEDPVFIPEFATSLSNMVYDIPSIILFSLFTATLLNKKFKGRGFVRAIFFLPVIVTTGIVIDILKGDAFANSILTGTRQDNYVFRIVGIGDILLSSGFNKKLVDYLLIIINRIFDIVWQCGVQTLLFLAGLQTIPPSLYEASEMEGATQWESFWIITLPMVSPIILVNLVYSVIDSFTNYMNKTMRMIIDIGIVQLKFGYASALAWIYFIAIFIIVAAVLGLVSRRIYYYTE